MPPTSSVTAQLNTALIDASVLLWKAGWSASLASTSLTSPRVTALAFIFPRDAAVLAAVKMRPGHRTV